MQLRLVVSEGPQKGDEVLIKEGVVIGRKGVDLNLSDPKVSSRHARIFKNDQSVLTIEDLGSSNGTYVNEIKITQWPLKAGDKVQIGRSIMVVNEGPEPKKEETWQDVVEGALADTLKESREKPPTTVSGASAFQTPITLEFIKGIQTGTTLCFGFGPRAVGKLCPDGLLFDPQAPDVAFELHPSETDLCELQTRVADLKINDKKSKSKEKLKDGDRISVGQTIIVIKSEEKI